MNHVAMNITQNSKFQITFYVINSERFTKYSTFIMTYEFTIIMALASNHRGSCSISTDFMCYSWCTMWHWWHFSQFSRSSHATHHFTTTSSLIIPVSCDV
jgi:hypothetical protein